MELPTIVLTRYLYIKHDVLVSLMISILYKNYEESLFWACELYYSGFEEEVADFIYTIYNEWCKSCNHPALFSYIEKLRDRYVEGPHIIATMIKNMTMRWIRGTAQYFVLREIDTPMPPPLQKKCIVVTVDPHECIKYQTMEESKWSARKVLNKVCLYSSQKQYKEAFHCIHASISSEILYQEHLQYSLYYAAWNTPIWTQRMEQYGGKLNSDTREIDFADEEQKQAFEEKYDYELEEQPLNVQEKLVHLFQTKQSTMEDFIQKLPNHIYQ